MALGSIYFQIALKDTIFSLNKSSTYAPLPIFNLFSCPFLIEQEILGLFLPLYFMKHRFLPSWVVG